MYNIYVQMYSMCVYVCICTSMDLSVKNNQSVNSYIIFIF